MQPKLTREDIAKIEISDFEDLIKLGGKMIAVTEGRKGASLIEEGNIIEMTAKKIKTIEEKLGTEIYKWRVGTIK